MMKCPGRLPSVVAIAGLLWLVGCPSPPGEEELSSARDITSFNLGAAAGTINESSLSVTVASDTDVTAIAASFATTADVVKIGDTLLESGVTPGDFTDPVTLTVYAEDGSSKDYVVTVTLPDAFEPNELYHQYSSLGTIFGTLPETSRTATISPSGDRDFYRFKAEEDGSIGGPFGDELFTLTVRLVPPQSPHGRNYDLYLYADGGALLEQSTLFGTDEDDVGHQWNGTVGPDDSKDFRIEVRGVDGAFTCCPYTLFLDLVETPL